MTGAEDWQLTFVERVSAAAELNGMPPSHAQVLAWLVVCEPSEQSGDDVRHALGLSAGTVSMAASALLGLGLIERIAHPGHRRMSYRLHPEGWEHLLRRRLAAAAELRAVAEEALAHATAPPAAAPPAAAAPTAGAVPTVAATTTAASTAGAVPATAAPATAARSAPDTGALLSAVRRLAAMRDLYAWFEDNASALLGQLAQRDQPVLGRSSAVPSTVRSTRSL